MADNRQWIVPKTRRGQRDRAALGEGEHQHQSDNDASLIARHDSLDTSNVPSETVRVVSTDWRKLVGEPVVLPPNSSKRPTKGLLCGVDMTQVFIPQPSSIDSEENNKSDFNVRDDFWPSIAKDVASNEHNVHAQSEWSSIVKTIPRTLPVIQHKEEIKDDIQPSGSFTDGSKKKKKKEKKHDQPVTFELSTIIDALQHSNLKQPTAKSGKQLVMGTAIPMAYSSGDKSETPTGGTRNVLDSSAPVIMRGKEKETPKKKKPSSLRKIVDKEKNERKQLMSEGMPIPVIVDMEVTTVTPATPNGATPNGLHNRYFRDYCTHLVTDKINASVENLMMDLMRFQDRVHKNEPLKFKAKRRYICGLREVKKHLTLKRLKCVIVPPNLQRIQSQGGIDDIVHSIIEQCKEQGVPVVFALTRRRLAFLLKKKYNIGCVGLFSIAGAEDKYKRLMDQVKGATEQYKQQHRKLLQGNPDKTTNDPLHTPESVKRLPDPLDNNETLTEDIDCLSDPLDNGLEESMEDEQESSDEEVTVKDWKELFNDSSTEKQPTEFLWNLDAPEFFPN
jgi:selenocysteine insertion sequence-binding protein 2